MCGLSKLHIVNPFFFCSEDTRLRSIIEELRNRKKLSTSIQKQKCNSLFSSNSNAKSDNSDSVQLSGKSSNQTDDNILHYENNTILESNKSNVMSLSSKKLPFDNNCNILCGSNADIILPDSKFTPQLSGSASPLVETDALLVKEKSKKNRKILEKPIAAFSTVSPVLALATLRVPEISWKAMSATEVPPTHVGIHRPVTPSASGVQRPLSNASAQSGDDKADFVRLFSLVPTQKAVPSSMQPPFVRPTTSPIIQPKTGFSGIKSQVPGRHQLNHSERIISSGRNGRNIHMDSHGDSNVLHHNHGHRHLPQQGNTGRNVLPQGQSNRHLFNQSHVGRNSHQLGHNERHLTKKFSQSVPSVASIATKLEHHHHYGAGSSRMYSPDSKLSRHSATQSHNVIQLPVPRSYNKRTTVITPEKMKSTTSSESRRSTSASCLVPCVAARAQQSSPFNIASSHFTSSKNKTSGPLDFNSLPLDFSKQSSLAQLSQGGRVSNDSAAGLSPASSRGQYKTDKCGAIDLTLKRKRSKTSDRSFSKRMLANDEMSAGRPIDLSKLASSSKQSVHPCQQWL